MEDKIKQALIDLGWKNPINFEIIHRYDELTIRCNVDGFEEREQNISKSNSNCNKPAVIGSLAILQEWLDYANGINISAPIAETEDYLATNDH